MYHSDVSTPVAFFEFTFVEWLEKSNLILVFASKYFGIGKYWLIYTMSFFINPTVKESL